MLACGAMEERPSVSARAVLLAVLLGAAPAAVALLAPRDTQRPLLQSLDVPLAAAAWGAGLLFALWRGGPRLPARGLLPAALLLALLPVAVQRALLPTPITTDERAYLLQADLFAHGRLAEPLPQPACEPGKNLCPLHRRQVYEDAQRGVRYAKYSPGTALAYAPGSALGAAWLVPGLLALADVALLYAIARRLGLQQPGAAALLLALSPFFLLVHASYQSEVCNLPAVLAGYACLLGARAADAGGRRRFLLGLGIGAAAGWVFCVRPLTGVLFAAACLPGLLWGPGKRGLTALAGAVAAGLPLLALALGYNALQTGDALAFPYHLYAERFGPWLDAQGQVPLDVYGKGVLWDGLLDHGARWAVGCGALGAVALGFLGLWRLRRSDGGTALAFSLLLPVAYALHWYPGHWAYLGPLYAFESLGFLLLGLAHTAEGAPPRLRRGIYAALACGGAALAVYRFGVMRQQSELCHAPEAAAAQAPAGAVVLLPYFSRKEVQADPALQEANDSSLKYYTPSRPPFAPGETVLMRELEGPRRTREALERMGLAGRPLFRFLSDGPTHGHLEPDQP